ncbi:hypothetical protein [Nitrosomonas marina]|uniref:Methyltransferase domain-containing protein n=1 Tax=Nitrosomonas marina TaxID=917 RepID=A0A1H8DWI6_9PROT|nr:hypothetical protein [Nitrosomonas marina]SEN11535.1 hypothetical protein SAMN05216325_10813 [Nitrosomonas marina]
MTRPDYDQFTCNLCGQESPVAQDFERETGLCSHCGSNVRFRALILALSEHLYSQPIPLSHFTPDRQFKAMGLSDASLYADKLASLFDYTNFFFHTEPFLDIRNIDHLASDTYDLLITSDVFEHVPPPRHVAFVNSWHLLKPDGLLLLTVPYSTLPKTIEHFPGLHEFEFIQDGNSILLINRRIDQTVEVYDKLTWHGGVGSTLEMRIFSETDLLYILSDTGFKDIKIWNEDVPLYGIHQAHLNCSYVITAIKDASATPPTADQYDPYIDYVYSQETAVLHSLPHTPVRVTGAPAKRIIAQWQNYSHKPAPSILGRAYRYIKSKFQNDNSNSA